MGIKRQRQRRVMQELLEHQAQRLEHMRIPAFVRKK
jgi:hypothetical protein